MRQNADRDFAMRMVVLRNTPEPRRARSELRQSFALLTAAIFILVGVVTLLLVGVAPLVGPTSRLAARWLVAALGVVTGALAYAAGKRFLTRSNELSQRKLRIEGGRMTFLGAGGTQHEILDLTRPFGVTLLGNRVRNRIILATTATGGTAYFAARVEPTDRYPHRALLSRASTVADDDPVLDATGPDGKPFELELRDLNDLVELFQRRDSRAFERCFLSDTHGTPVILDGAELHIGRKDFDLQAPLEWRATVFQEPFTMLVALSDRDTQPQSSGGVMLYQATWVRQGASEAVLVSLLASLSSATWSHPPASEVPEVASAILRDARLMQATPEAPPPSDLCVGIERTYMLRLRAALDRAPRASHRDIPSGAAAR